MTVEITEAERLAAIERKLQKLTGPRPAPIAPGPFFEAVGARQELAREARRREKARRDAELAEQLRREAPARRRRAQELEQIRHQVAVKEAELAKLRDELQSVSRRPLDLVA